MQVKAVMAADVGHLKAIRLLPFAAAEMGTMAGDLKFHYVV
jgi:hypothetical protein